MSNFKTAIEPKKLTTKQWAILNYYIGGHVGNCHSYMKGHKIERLCTLQPMSNEDHGVNFNHAKNWNDVSLIPQELKDKAVAFWKSTLSAEDFQYFEERDLVWI